MVPTDFEGSNLVLGKPPEMLDEDCTPLNVRIGQESGYPVIVSCWKLTQEEVDELIKTGRIYLTVYGQMMPPVSLSGKKPFDD